MPSQAPDILRRSMNQSVADSLQAESTYLGKNNQLH